MTMSYDYENRREADQPTAQKRRRGEHEPVPLHERPGNPEYRQPVPAWVWWVVRAALLLAVAGALKWAGVW